MELAIETRDTSYEKLEGSLGNRQRAVFDTLSVCGPMTNGEIAHRLCLPINSITGRTYELRKAERVVAGGKRTCTVSGEMCMTWKVNE
jgi:hypothetical protein